MDKNRMWEIMTGTFDIQSEEIGTLAQRMDPNQIDQLVKALIKCKQDKRCIVLCGCGTSGMAAKVIMHLLCCLEYSALFMPPSDSLHGESGFINEGDLVLLFSKGGLSEELDSMLKIARNKKATTVAVVSKQDSELARNSELVLKVPIERESDPANTLPTSSILNVISIFHGIFNILMEHDDYQLSQLGAIHPGGAVGKKLAPGE